MSSAKLTTLEVNVEQGVNLVWTHVCTEKENLAMFFM